MSMKHRGRLIGVLDRAETGPIMDEKEFEKMLVAPTSKRLVKQYEIKRDPDVIVPSDDGMADRLFQAGMDFAAEVGMFCTSTSRRIVWSRRDYEEGVSFCPNETSLGTGVDKVVVRSRKPESTIPPIILGGPYGVEVSEELYVPLMLSYAQEGVIDVIDNATLKSVYGRSPKAASPWEVLGGWREAELSKQVVKRAGRPEMCIAGVELSPTALGEISASSWGGFRPEDLHHVAGISEFKTNYESLSKLTHLTRIGGSIYAFMACIYGGFFGGAEGVALGLTAAAIVLNQNYMPSISSLSSVHPFLQCTTTPEILWAFSVASQAISRNSGLIISSLVRPSSGPGTKTMLYENAAFSVATTVSGQSFIQASMSAAGTHPHHASGLDAKICGEVAHATALNGITRQEANVLVKRLYEIYQPDLEKHLPGQPFEEVYDLRTVRPTQQWQNTYDEVKSELVKMGIPLDRLN
jgi:methylamine--corrinoid protein Co-methyltransferase